MPRTELKRRFITFGQPDLTIEEINAVTYVLKSKWIGTGKITNDFESEFVKYMGGGYAVAVSSCSIGLVIALRSVGICHGDKVLTSPLTFCATVNAILQVGAMPVFCEVTKDGLIDPWEVAQFKEIDAILPVNYTGLQSSIWKNPGVPVIEDAAHSFGGTFKGQKQGSFGDLSVFSFYATKNITSGEGGMIWTKNKELADKCRLLSQNGQSSGAWGRYNSGPIENYQVLHPGYKGNLPDILSAIGLTQLKRWPQLEEKRAKVWEIYEDAFGPRPDGHSKHLFTIRVKNRHQIREVLYNKGIATGVHYEALHLEPAYKYLGYKKGDFPIAEKIAEETLSLPVSNTMTEDEARYVVDEVTDALRKT